MSRFSTFFITFILFVINIKENFISKLRVYSSKDSFLLKFFQKCVVRKLKKSLNQLYIGTNYSRFNVPAS